MFSRRAYPGRSLVLAPKCKQLAAVRRRSPELRLCGFDMLKTRHLLREAPGPRQERRTFMPTYVILMSYTQQGIENIKESPERLDAAKDAAKSMGVDIRDFYLAMGQYDAVLVVEAPDDNSITSFALASASLGNVRTETLRVYPEDEFRNLVADLP
jgi:uncharacterized protein with GYD domain